MRQVICVRRWPAAPAHRRWACAGRRAFRRFAPDNANKVSPPPVSPTGALQTHDETSPRVWPDECSHPRGGINLQNTAHRVTPFITRCDTLQQREIKTAIFDRTKVTNDADPRAWPARRRRPEKPQTRKSKFSRPPLNSAGKPPLRRIAGRNPPRGSGFHRVERPQRSRGRLDARERNRPARHRRQFARRAGRPCEK